jgi:hypothetical protein
MRTAAVTIGRRSGPCCTDGSMPVTIVLSMLRNVLPGSTSMPWLAARSTTKKFTE